mmetsp:Transcript_83798/g.130774  ORF Transcript_83798/g.130774 Transcript_83798/m.130774 type:complete len:235 (+) Transcript_83798:54-758(+)
MAFQTFALAFATFCVSVDGASLRFRQEEKKVNETSLPFDCYVDKGAEYVGLKDFSQSGRTCKNWLKEESKKYTPTTKGIGNHNYCRNPSGEKDKPWCFTVDPAVEWEFCEVPECKDEGKAPEPWVAPDGAKSKGSKPCEYKPPKVLGYKEHKAGRACKDHEGTTWWLISNNKTKVADVDGCKEKCSTLPGTEYFTFFTTDDKEGHNCGCYRECVLVAEDLTVNGPTAYRMDPLR